MPKKILHNWVSVSYLLMYKILKDKDGLINDLGIDRENRSAKNELHIAKAYASKEVAIEQAKANNESNIEKIKTDTEIAERENALAIKKAALKLSEDTARAKADAAYKIQDRHPGKK